MSGRGHAGPASVRKAREGSNLFRPDAHRVAQHRIRFRVLALRAQRDGELLRRELGTPIAALHEPDEPAQTFPVESLRLRPAPLLRDDRAELEHTRCVSVAAIAHLPADLEAAADHRL